MKRRMNPLCSCPKTGAFVSVEDAERRLAAIQAAPADPNRMYSPTGVIACPVQSGVWHLTSATAKPGRAGKKRRDLRVRRRR